MVKRVIASNEALEVIDLLKKEHGELVFNQSGGCCDGTAPMCYEKGDFYVPSRNVKMGEIAQCEFFIDAQQFEYFKNCEVTVDVKKENAAFGNSFSLEIDMGYQFVTKSRLFTNEELEELSKQEN